MQMEPLMTLINAARADAHYQTLLRQCEELGEEYDRILQTLCPEDRELLDRYISICENMEYRKVCLAIEIWAKKSN